SRALHICYCTCARAPRAHKAPRRTTSPPSRALEDTGPGAAPAPHAVLSTPMAHAGEDSGALPASTSPEGTSVAAPLAPEQKDVPSPPAAGQGGFLRGFARVVVGNAVLVLVVVTALLGGAAWAHFKLVGLRDGLVFIPSHNAELFRDFPAMSDPSHDAFVFWCNGCDLTKEPEFDSRFNATIATLDRISKEEYWCADLEWSSYQSPVHGLPSDVYMSQGNSVSFVEFHFSTKKCMTAVREALKPLRTGEGRVLSAQGGPETAAAASMEAEFGTSMKHSMIAMPICAFILWMVVGNVFRATTPMLVVGASFLSGQSAVVAAKEVFPGLDVNFDDSMALFVVLALAVDYALFFWTRFNQERDRCQDYGEAVLVTLHRSSQVIIVSNVFVTMAYVPRAVPKPAAAPVPDFGPVA
ncbi:unnamed protein product, partial [Prorocentrum cordatum]